MRIEAAGLASASRGAVCPCGARKARVCSETGSFELLPRADRKSLHELPRAAKLDTRSELLAFHSRYYSASIMQLCCLGAEPLETLERWVSAAFAEAPNLRIERPTAATALPPMAPGTLPLALCVTPLAQGRQLSAQWYLPSQQSDAAAACAPCDLIGHLVGHEGRGSLLSHLKARGLAVSLAAGLDEGDSTSAAALFRVEIELTREGVRHAKDVVGALCGYVGMLAGGPGGAPPVWLWEEMRDLAALHFRFSEQEAE